MTNKDYDQGKEQKDAYSELGIAPGTTFEEIQKARDKKLAEAGDDILLKAKIESSYDSLLMNSLKERRQGKISNEAVSASQKEKNGINLSNNSLKETFFKRFNLNNSGSNSDIKQDSIASFDLPKSEGFTLRFAIGVLIIVLLLVAPDNYIQLILSISTIALVISQLKRGRKILQSLGWSVVFLSCGYILGGLIVGGLDSSNHQSLGISVDKLEAIPALILLWIGSFF